MVLCITWNVFHMRQFCRIVYCWAWFDTVEFICLPCPNNEMYDDAVFADRFDVNWLCLKCLYWQGYLDSLTLMLHMKFLYNKSRLVTVVIRETISQAGLYWKASLNGDNRYMDGHRESDDISHSREILDLHSYIYIYIYIYILIFLTYLYSFFITYNIP